MKTNFKITGNGKSTEVQVNNPTLVARQGTNGKFYLSMDSATYTQILGQLMIQGHRVQDFYEQTEEELVVNGEENELM